MKQPATQLLVFANELSGFETTCRDESFCSSKSETSCKSNNGSKNYFKNKKMNFVFIVADNQYIFFNKQHHANY